VTPPGFGPATEPAPGGTPPSVPPRSTARRWLISVAVMLGMPVLATATLLVAWRLELDRPVGSPRPATVAVFPVGSSRPATVPSSPPGSPPAFQPGDHGALPVSCLNENSGLFLRVPRGVSLRAVTGRLQSLGWIERSWGMRLEARHRGLDRRVVPGWYRHCSGERVRDLLARLTSGEFEQAWCTIPEGWGSARILSVLADSAWIPIEALRDVSLDERWLADQSVPGPGIEGYIFPDTYRLPRGEEPRALLHQLIQPGLAFWEDSLRTAAERLGMDRRAVWTLASIVEAEAASPAERRRISAVFLNRLRRGMRLESDPTVLYALGRPPGRVLYADLEVNSPYNTYRRVGLPPGPICSPGRASLRAAVDPEPDCVALFFVARGDGTHVFSRTLAEHDRARGVLRARIANTRPRRTHP